MKDLRPEDFVPTENGNPQSIVHFTQDNDIPVSLGILIDTSGSMNTTFSGITVMRAAAGTTRVLLRMMKPGDAFLLMIDFVEQIAAELRGQYTLGYYPQSELKTTDAIRVRTTSSEYQVRVRRDDIKLGEDP